MNKNNGLLSSVAEKYNIQKGIQETEKAWKTRLVYSICGMMAYASLWDELDEGPVSLVHLKRRVCRMLENYKILYPELLSSLPIVSKELEDEIADQFINTGIVYHRPNRIVPSMKREELYEGILFQRGIALDRISCVSGLGLYSIHNKGEASPSGIKSMFGLEQKNIQALWLETISAAVWKTGQMLENNTEYLRIEPPFSREYWGNTPDVTGAVSILRTGAEGSQLYYLYRCYNADIEISPLPQWQVDSYNYRAIACACLLNHGTLPPIAYLEDGPLVHVHLNYLLPPRELEFLKLYSWPEECTVLPSVFNRKLSKEVFVAIRSILSDEGYQFVGGTL